MIGAPIASNKALAVTCISSQTPVAPTPSPQIQLQTPSHGDLKLDLPSTDNVAALEMKPPDIFAQLCSSLESFNAQNPVQNVTIAVDIQVPSNFEPQSQAQHFALHSAMVPALTAAAVPSATDTAVDDLFDYLCASSGTERSQQESQTQTVQPVGNCIPVPIEDCDENHSSHPPMYTHASVGSSIPRDSSLQNIHHADHAIGTSSMIMQDDFPVADGDSSWMDRIFD